MSKSSRRRAGTRAAADVSDLEFPSEVELLALSNNADPALVVMDVLLDRMLGAAGLTVVEAGQNDTVVLLALARTLVTRRVLDGNEVAAIVAQHPVAVVL